ncbi:UNVERIFIED_CONTAM: hypothetical protein GTU68_039893 [Idotea baltica]|nr:hypothetical protein [Idotea baltica]
MRALRGWGGPMSVAICEIPARTASGLVFDE